MEAGYDYLHGRLRRRVANLTGILLLVIGLLLLASGGAYYAYSVKAKSNLGDLIVDFAPRTVPRIAGVTASNVSLFPGKTIAAASWNDPFGYEPLYFREQRWLEGFTPIVKFSPVITAIPPSTRILVPSIGIDSTISELAIVDLVDSRYYESPNNTVGHLPETANPGETGTAWFFGHTESPVSREGSVFFNLQKVPNMLRNGKDVFIITDNGETQFLYRATSSQVLHHEDLTLDTQPFANIKLVSSVPRFVYDHRLVVSGELIGLR